MTPVEHARDDTSIREATRADLLDVLRIEKSVFPQPWPYSAFEGHVNAPGFLVSERNTGGEADTRTVDGERSSEADDKSGSLATGSESIAGYVIADKVSNHGRPLGHVKNLAVRPDCRGEGVGSALLERSLSVLTTQDVRGVKLEVRRGNDAAIGLYRSFGFERLRTLSGYYADGEDALLFVLNFEDRDAF